MHKTIKGLEAQIRLKEIKLEIPDAGINHLIKADENILSFAFRNILSNAIKFSPEGSKIRVICSESETEHIFEVIDQGYGISLDRLHKLRSNESISSEGTSAEKGTVMGIALSREFLAAMGGSLEIESELEKGTTVRIRLSR